MHINQKVAQAFATRASTQNLKSKARDAKIMDSANGYLVRSRSTDSQVIAYSGTQAFTNLADACDLLRYGRNNALKVETRD